ncbi:MAG TPA: hypothetical protein VEK08_22520 [Planctomycetota bacterium]|nr:hypothetical protein [Planctomycetota bacterium]
MQQTRFQFHLATYFLVLLALGAMLGANILPSRATAVNWFGYGNYTCYGWPFAFGLRTSETRIQIELALLAANMAVLGGNLYLIAMCAEIWCRFGSDALPHVYQSPRANRIMMSLVPAWVTFQLLASANLSAEPIVSCNIINGYTYGFPVRMLEAGVQNYMRWDAFGASINASVAIAAITATVLLCRWQMRRLSQAQDLK